MGLNYSMQLIMSGVLNVTQVRRATRCYYWKESNAKELVGVSSSIWTIDRFGRRPLLLWGSFFMTISHLIIAVFVGKYNKNWPDHRGAGWASVTFVSRCPNACFSPPPSSGGYPFLAYNSRQLLFYMLSFGATWGPVPWAMPSEIFPSSLRAKGVALATCSNWLNNFLIVS